MSLTPCHNVEKHVMEHVNFAMFQYQEPYIFRTKCAKSNFLTNLKSPVGLLFHVGERTCVSTNVRTISSVSYTYSTAFPQGGGWVPIHVHFINKAAKDCLYAHLYPTNIGITRGHTLGDNRSGSERWEGSTFGLL